jgi:hypothetical protein
VTAVEERPVIVATQDEATADYHRRSIRELEVTIDQKLAALRHHVTELERWDAESFAAALRLLVIGFMAKVSADDTTGTQAAARLVEHFADSDDPRRLGADVARFFASAKLPDCADENEDCGACPDCDFWLIRSRYDDPQGDDVQAVLAQLADTRRRLYDAGVPRPEWVTFPRELIAQDEARATELQREILERETELGRLAARWPAPHARLYATGRKDGQEAAK